MAVTMTGVYGATLENTADLLAASDTWQTWTDSDNATEAEAHISYITDIVENVTRPNALVYLGDDCSLSRIGQVKFNNWLSGTVYIRFEADINSTYEDDPEQACKYFLQQVYSCVEDMADLADTSGYLSISEFSPADSVQLASKSEGEEDVFFTYTFGLTLG